MEACWPPEGQSGFPSSVPAGKHAVRAQECHPGLPSPRQAPAWGPVLGSLHSTEGDRLFLRFSLYLGPFPSDQSRCGGGQVRPALTPRGPTVQQRWRKKLLSSGLTWSKLFPTRCLLQAQVPRTGEASRLLKPLRVVCQLRIRKEAERKSEKTLHWETFWGTTGNRAPP